MVCSRGESLTHHTKPMPKTKEEEQKKPLSLKERMYVQSALDRGRFLYDHDEYLDLIAEKFQEVMSKWYDGDSSEKFNSECFLEVTSAIHSVLAFHRQYQEHQSRTGEVAGGAILCRRLRNHEPIEVLPRLSQKQLEKLEKDQEEDK